MTWRVRRALTIWAFIAATILNAGIGMAQHEPEPERVNVNTADVQLLSTLPGIGPTRAAAIIRHRQRRPFKRVRELLRVRGIGRATLRRLMPLVTVGEVARSASSKRRFQAPRPHQKRRVSVTIRPM